MEIKIQNSQESRLALAEAGSPTIPEMQILLDDIRVSISAARRQEHEAAQNAGFKPLLAESSESTRLKAKLSGLWSRDLPLMEYAVGEEEQTLPH